MKTKFLTFLTLTTVLTSASAFSANQPVVVGYWSDWGIYWPERPYAVSGSNNNGAVITNPDLDSQLAKLDIVNYAFLEVDTSDPIQDQSNYKITLNPNNGSLYFYDPWADLSSKDVEFCKQHSAMCQNQDVSWNRGNFQALLAQKNKYPNLKVAISVGGWDHDASFEGRNINLKNPNNPNETISVHIPGAFEKPEKLVESLKALVNEYHIDGIDLDYEPQQGFNATNSKQLVNLVNAIHEALPNLIITLAVFANSGKVKAFDDGANHNWQAIAKNIKYLYVMGYDMHGSFDNPQITGLQSGLYFDQNEPTDPAFPHFNVDEAIKTYLAVGVPAEKIVMGIPSYARFVGGVPATNNGLFQSFTTTPMGDLGAPGGMESYYAIAQQWLNSGGFSEYISTVNGQASGAWAYNPSTQTFGSYDNTVVIDSKVRYIKEKGLGGIMMWELRSDLPANDEASLLKHMAKVKG